MRRMLRFTAVALAVAALLAIASPARGQTTAEDSVVGSGTAFGGEFVFDFDARSGPSGENATGRGTFHYFPALIFIDGPVTCLAVQGNVARLNIQSSIFGIVPFEITDNSATGSADAIRTVLEGRAPGDCSPLEDRCCATIRILLSSGDLAITDARPLPTFKDQCKNGGWRSYGIFKNQGDCVSFVATKGKNPLAGGP